MRVSFSFLNEGIATSGVDPKLHRKHTVTINNVVARRCTVGLELGYGEPIVVASSSIFSGNEIGVRYGDEYSMGHR